MFIALSKKIILNFIAKPKLIFPSTSFNCCLVIHLFINPCIHLAANIIQTQDQFYIIILLILFFEIYFRMLISTSSAILRLTVDIQNARA